jgi:hypothetical protein
VQYSSLIEKDSNLVVNYDFTSGSYYNGLSYVYSNAEDSNLSQLAELINLPTSSPSEYKGQILGDSSNVTGHFAGDSSSKGFFFEGKSYVSIEDIGADDIKNYSFLFSQEKVDSDPEIIFSNFQNDISDPKGFEFGINSANKLYFEYIDHSGTKVFTLNNIPNKKNIYSVEINTEGNNLSLSWWNPFEENFDSQNFKIDGNYIIKSDVWNIGSGSYSDMSCRGYVDKFLFFDNDVGSTEKELLCRSMYQDIEYVPPTSGVISGAVTGYEQTIDETISGITGYETIITGYTGNYKFYDRITGHNLYGTVPSGDYIYELDTEIYTEFDLYKRSITGIYEVVEVDVPTYGVTGFATGSKTESYSWDIRPLYFYSGVSGELYNTYISTPLTGDDYYYRVTDGEYSLSGSAPTISFDGLNGYGPKNYTYLGARNPPKDLIETQRGVNLFSVNNFAGVNFSEEFEDICYYNRLKDLNLNLSEEELLRRGQPLVFMPSDISFNHADAALYVNGVSQAKGSLSEGLFDNKRKYFYVESGSFCPVSGNYEHSPFYALYEDRDLSMIVDSPLVDVLGAHDVQYLKINDTSEYLAAPFSEIDPSAPKIFLNGKKIFEGIDFINDGGNFSPIGDTLQVTGVYSTEGDWRYDDDSLDLSSVTGYGAYDISSPQPFIIGAFASNLNGIRLDPKAFIYHDSSVDLLSQGYSFIVENEKKNVYNNRVNEFLTQEVVGESIIVMKSGEDRDYVLEGALTDSGKVISSNWDAAPGLIPSYSDPKEITDLGYDEV